MAPRGARKITGIHLAKHRSGAIRAVLKAKELMKRLLMIGAASLATASMGLAADETTVRYDTTRDYDRTMVVEHDTERNWVAYQANELDFALFGTGTVGERTLRNPSSRRIERNGKLGLGTGISYFFCRYVGIEAYTYTESTHHHLIDNVGGDLIARLPIAETGLAPYVFGGGGRQFDPIYQWTLDAGGGLEWRFSPHVGVFVDARYVWADKTKDYGLGRLGLRFGF